MPAPEGHRSASSSLKWVFFYFAPVASADKAFTAMQFIAAVVVSVSMVLFTLALFRPAAGLKCCSVKSLAIAAGSLMIAFAFFEMLAFVLIIVIEKELDGGECYGVLAPRYKPGFMSCATAVITCALRFTRAGDNQPSCTTVVFFDAFLARTVLLAHLLVSCSKRALSLLCI